MQLIGVKYVQHLIVHKGLYTESDRGKVDIHDWGTVTTVVHSGGGRIRNQNSSLSFMRLLVWLQRQVSVYKKNATRSCASVCKQRLVKAEVSILTSSNQKRERIKCKRSSTTNIVSELQKYFKNTVGIRRLLQRRRCKAASMCSDCCTSAPCACVWF